MGWSGPSQAPAQEAATDLGFGEVWGGGGEERGGWLRRRRPGCRRLPCGRPDSDCYYDDSEKEGKQEGGDGVPPESLVGERRKGEKVRLASRELALGQLSLNFYLDFDKKRIYLDVTCLKIRVVSVTFLQPLMTDPRVLFRY